ncbi:MAG: hypothetical protein KAJ75_09580, partial [Alphaproteobacteria bacterium]|nr:hypothetical protein [Alphaproteobacteria bacterium]
MNKNNCILAYPNRVDDSATTFSGGSWETALPLSNLKNRYLTKVARSTDAQKANTILNVDLATNRFVQVFALLKHNISNSGYIRVRAWDDAEHTIMLYDSDWKWAWPVVYADGQLEWEDDEWWTMSWPADTNYPLFHLIVLDTPVSARYWSVEIDDEDNPAGYIEAGRLVMASGWQPDKNFSYGAGLGWMSNTLADRTPGGVADFDERPSQRIQRLSLDHLTNDEAFALMLD